MQFFSEAAKAERRQRHIARIDDEIKAAVSKVETAQCELQDAIAAAECPHAPSHAARMVPIRESAVRRAEGEVTLLQQRRQELMNEPQGATHAEVNA